MKKQILSIIMAGCLLLSMTACSSDKKNTKSASEQTTADTSTSTTSPQEYSKTDFVMSTVLSEKIYGTKDVAQDIKEELDKLEKEQLSWREDSSVVSKINADAQKGIKTKLDSDMTLWVEDSLELARRSNGAFDPTIGRLTRLWNIEGDNPKVPSKQEIKNTLKDTGYTKIHLEKVETQNTATTKKNVDKDRKDNTDKNIPVILEFEFLPLQYFENEKYSTKIFNSYNEEFAKFVFQNRYHLDEKHKYDLIFGVMSDSNPMLLIQQYREKKITENEVIDGLRKSTSMKQLSIHNQELCDIIKLNKAYYLNGKELNINEYCNK